MRSSSSMLVAAAWILAASVIAVADGPGSSGGAAVTSETSRPLPVSLSVVPPGHLSSKRASLVMRAMVEEAEAIWRPYGVTVGRHGDGPATAGGVRLHVRFESWIAPVNPQLDAPRLGAIAFEEGVPTAIITMADGAVAAVMAVAGTPGAPGFVELTRHTPRGRLGRLSGAAADSMQGRALGRVLAHELGHFLLAWPGHTPSGLLRPSFDGPALMSWSRGEFSIDPLYVPRLNARLARLRTDADPPPSGNIR